jgi:transposase
MAKDARFTIPKFSFTCPSFGQFVQVFLNMQNGSDTSRTQLSHEARLAEALAKRAVTLSRPAKQRLKWMEHFGKYRNARLTCRHFGISPDTFYLWRRRFRPDNLLTLEDNKKSRRPQKLRSSKHLATQLETVRKLREVNPKIGKVRIAKILKEMGYSISPSTISRILSAFKKPV